MININNNNRRRYLLYLHVVALYLFGFSSRSIILIAAAPIQTCDTQSDCVSFSISECDQEQCSSSASSTALDKACEFVVCFTLSMEGSNCPSTLSGHTCEKDDTICQNNKSNGFYKSTLVKKPSKGYTQCQTVGPNTDVEFLLMDGSGGCNVNGIAPTFYTINDYDTTCSPRHKSIRTCSGYKIGTECVWTIRTPAKCTIEREVKHPNGNNNNGNTQSPKVIEEGNAAGTTPDKDQENSNSSSGSDNSDNSGLGARGDPHIKMWDGTMYDFHGICDLVLLHNPFFHHGLGMDIHIRTKKTKKWSYIYAAVLRLGVDTFEVMGGRGRSNGHGNRSRSRSRSRSIGRQHHSNSSSSSSSSQQHAQYWINGVPGKDINELNAAGTMLPVLLSGYPITYKQLSTTQHEFKVYLGGGYGEEVIFKTWNDFVRVDIHNAQYINFESSVGLMGTFSSSSTTTTTDSTTNIDRRTVKIGRDHQTIFTDNNNFGQEWQVMPWDPKLFHTYNNNDNENENENDYHYYVPPQFPAKCEIPTKSAVRRRLRESSITQTQAEQICKQIVPNINHDDLQLCIFDVIVTNDTKVAQSYQ